METLTRAETTKLVKRIIRQRGDYCEFEAALLNTVGEFKTMQRNLARDNFKKTFLACLPPEQLNQGYAAGAK